MKPTTKLQKRVYELSQALPPITQEQEEYGHQHCFDHFGYRIKKGTSCLECGELFQTKSSRCKCPKCGVMLKIEDTRARKLKVKSYYGILTTSGGFQVIRLFMQSQWLSVGAKSNYHTTEVVQHWLRPDGKHTVVARTCTFGYAYSDSWNSFSSLEIRNYEPTPRHNINPMAIHPKRGIISILKRNGFKSSCHDIAPLTLFKLLICGGYGETLFKSGYYGIMRHIIKSYSSYDPFVMFYWNSFKICLRNKYIIEDASIWFDYIDLLRYFKKDRRNAKYVCPSNLNEAHDRLVRKKRLVLDAEERERERLRALGDEERIQKENQIFLKDKSKFFGIVLSDANLKIVVLKSVDEYKQEGDILHHCVYTGKYFAKSDRLILSARVKNKRIATIEVSLETMEIIQCRGPHNNKPSHYDQIVNLVNKNIGIIQKRITA